MILGIDHVGVAVRGAAESGTTFARLTGRSAGDVETIQGQAVRVCFVPGLASPEDLQPPRATNATANTGGRPAGAPAGPRGARLELVEPLGEDGPVGRFLARRGEGLHHVCFAVDDIGAEMARLRAAGFEMIDTAPRPGHGGLVAFLHPRGTHGVLIELLQPALPLTPRVSAVAEAPSAAATGDEETLIVAVLAGDRRALARLLTRIEARSDVAEVVARRLLPHTGRAHVVGVTGAPGTGKSTLVAALASELRRAGSTVGIIAVDPSSPRSGGALLGDRIRMSALAGDDGVFVRSMASRGTGGALAKQTAATAAVLDAAGFDTVLVETVGAGQDELAVADEAQTTVVVTAPGQGDEVQALKAGILEIADILVVNKADQSGADRLVAALTFGHAQSSVHAGAESATLADETAPWGVAVLKTVATTAGGVAELAVALRQHRDWLTSGAPSTRDARALAERRITRWAAAQAVERATAAARRSGAWVGLVDEVVSGRLAPSAAAAALLNGTVGTASGTASGAPQARAHDLPPADAPAAAAAPLSAPGIPADGRLSVRPPALRRAGETVPGR